jgi:hypothetical protein
MIPRRSSRSSSAGSTATDAKRASRAAGGRPASVKYHPERGPVIVAVVQDGALSHAHAPHDRAEVAPISPVPNEVTERRCESAVAGAQDGTSAVGAGGQRSRPIGGYALAARAVRRAITTSTTLPWPRRNRRSAPDHRHGAPRQNQVDDDRFRTQGLGGSRYLSNISGEVNR